MGRGSQSDNYLNTTWFKIIGVKKGSTEVYLEGKQKQGTEYVWDGNKDSFIEGTIIGCEPGEYEYEGKKYDTIKVTLQDKADAYVLSMGYSNLCISFLNSLGWAAKQYDKLNGCKISVYMSKSGYPSIFVEVNGEKTEWLMTWDSLQPYITKTDLPGGDVHIDKSKLVEVLKKLIEKEIKPKLSKEIPKSEFEDSSNPPSDFMAPTGNEAPATSTPQENSGTPNSNGRTNYQTPAVGTDQVPDMDDLPF